VLVFGDKCLKSVVDHLLVLVIEIQPIGGPTHLVPAVLVRIQARRTPPIRTAPSLSLERAGRIQIVASWDSI